MDAPAAAEGYGASVPERLFVFVQMEFPWPLGPANGRYVLRASEGAEPERVVVLGTLGTHIGEPERLGRRPGTRARARRRLVPASAEPALVEAMRATIVDPVPLPSERQAQAWLAGLDAEREAHAAAAVLNRVVHLHRIAAADPYVREISAAGALVIRAGWGEGEQVADGAWLHARELPPVTAKNDSVARGPVRSDRTAALRPQERLAELLSARSAPLLCEELVLRARLDLDHGRAPSAAVGLQAAYAAALGELRRERREDLATRIVELEELRPGVEEQAQAALAAAAGDEPADGASPSEQEAVVRHALERLEAVLRARTAPGFRR